MSGFRYSTGSQTIACNSLQTQLTRFPTLRPKSWFMFYTSVVWPQVAKDVKKPRFGKSETALFRERCNFMPGTGGPATGLPMQFDAKRLARTDKAV